jgi:hypothetical protein
MPNLSQFLLDYTVIDFALLDPAEALISDADFGTCFSIL